jgi:hypothetical protein
MGKLEELPRQIDWEPTNSSLLYKNSANDNDKAMASTVISLFFTARLCCLRTPLQLARYRNNVFSSSRTLLIQSGVAIKKINVHK